MLGLLGVAGEDDETSLVRLQTLNIERLALLAQVSPPVVNNNADTTGLLLADASLLELSKSEASSLAKLPVVADGLGTDSGTEEGKRANAKCGRLGFAGLATAELASGLVEPGLDTGLPVLAEMVLVEDCT